MRLALFFGTLLACVLLSSSVASADSCACGGYTWTFDGRTYNGSTTGCFWRRADGAYAAQSFSGNVGCPASYP